MKKVLMIICLCLFLVSCGSSSVDQLNSIRKDFKQDVSVCSLPITGEFIVKVEDGSLWFVKFTRQSMLIGLPPINVKHKIQFDIDIKQEIIIKQNMGNSR
jgi:hypothetical protein